MIKRVNEKMINGISYQIDAFGRWGVATADKEIVSANIESYIDGSPVEFIGDFAFQNHQNLTSITIPDKIRLVGSCIFDGCKNIKHVQFSQALVNRPDADTLFEQLWNAGLHTREVLLRQPTI